MNLLFATSTKLLRHHDQQNQYLFKTITRATYLPFLSFLLDASSQQLA